MDELALFGHPISVEDLTDKILHGLGINSDFQSVIDGIQNRPL